MYAAKCESLVKDFQSGNGFQRVLFGIDLVIPFGKITLLAGPSGCGKTTILSILAGLLDPTSGNAEVLGKDIGWMRGRQKVAFRGKNIGFVFQQYNLLPALTACENVAVPLVILGQARSKAIELARQTLVKVGLEDKMDSIPKNLSGGQQQRVAIARALVHQPRLLLCDEPTAALDAASGHTVMELLREVALVPERAVVIVTHDNRVYSFGDRMIRIADGRVEQTLEDPSSFTAKVF